MEIEFAQNQKRSWYCTKINLQSADINAGVNQMRKAIIQVTSFLEEIDKKQSKLAKKEIVKSKKK
jgi:hypothetical protein